VSSNGENDDLRAALTCRPNVESDAFDVLYEQLETVREELEIIIGRPLSSGIEATYVIYPVGGFYKRHIDSLEGIDPGGSGRRSISFICYLPDPEPAWTPDDGGQLRVFSSDVPGSDFVDLLPESGSLVLFDSKSVWHEVMPTQRERACLVGWFRES
jgi:SM-20-related protein